MYVEFINPIFSVLFMPYCFPWEISLGNTGVVFVSFFQQHHMDVSDFGCPWTQLSLMCEFLVCVKQKFLRVPSMHDFPNFMLLYFIPFLLLQFSSRDSNLPA